MTVTSFTQFISLYRELLLKTQNSSVLLKMWYFGCTPMRNDLLDRVGILSKLKIVCDIDTV